MQTRLQDYTPRGAIVEFDGVKFYVVGEDNKPAIIQVYDIFGASSCATGNVVR